MLKTSDSLDDIRKRLTSVEQRLAGRTLADIVRRHIFETLDSMDWNKTRAARQLGISYMTLNRKLKLYTGRKSKGGRND